MAIIPRTSVTTNVTTEKQNSDTFTPFDVTLAAAATAEDLVLVPATKRGRTLSIVNEGPGDAAIKFDGTATATDVLLKEGDAFNNDNLDFATKVSFINVTTGDQPRLRGMLGSGPARCQHLPHGQDGRRKARVRCERFTHGTPSPER